MSFDESSLYEIIELKNGDVALAKDGKESEPLVSICFSQEAKNYLENSKLSVAKAMIEAGLEAAFGLEDDDFEEMERSAVEILH